MAYENCIAEIEKAAQGALTRADIEDNLEAINRRFEKRLRKNPLESRQAATKAIG